jgi:hypothetical protein
MVQYLYYGMNCAGFRIVGSEYQSLQPGVNHRPRAHRARLNGGKQFASPQAMIPEGHSGFAKRDDFSVRGRIGAGEIAIPAGSNYLPRVNYDRADWNFAFLQSALSRTQCLFHPEFVRIGLPRHESGSL